MRYALLLVSATFVVSMSPECRAAEADIDARIEGIVTNLVPPVVVKGVISPPITLAERMRALHVPGVSVAVIHDGRIDWARGFGVTKFGGAAITPNTLFQAASISKPVTAAAVMRLAEAGKLNLDTDVNSYLKGWKVPKNSFTAKTKLTLRELLSHTGGVTVHGFNGYAAGQALPSVVDILSGRLLANNPPITVDTVPGSAWRYSGGGYVIAQQVLDDLTGQPFPELMRKLVLGPAAMTHSTYEQPLPQQRMSEVALPHEATGEPIPGGPHTYPEMAPAGLWTTPSDLAHFALKVQEALSGKSSQFLSKVTVEEMLKPGLGDRGMGFQIGGHHGPLYFTHSGSNAGYQCELLVYEDGDGAVIMTNSDNGSRLTYQLERTISRDYGWPDYPPPVERAAVAIDAGAADRIAGNYDTSVGGLITVRHDGDKLFVNGLNNEETELFPEANGRFFVTSVNIEYVFPTSGELSGKVLKGDGDTNYTFTKIPDGKIDPKIFDTFVGRYKFDGEKTSYTSVVRQGDRLYVDFGTRRFEMLPVSDRKFIVKTLPMTALFQLDAASHVRQVEWLQNGESNLARPTVP